MTKIKFQHEPDDNGLFPAVDSTENPDMEKYWIRDNYWIWRAGYSQDSIAQAFNKIVQKHKYKIDYHCYREQPVRNYQHIHVRYDSDLSEVTGDWKHMQFDTLPYLIDMTNLDNQLKIIDYLNAVGVYPGFGPWEEGRRKYHPFSLAKFIETADHWIYKHEDNEELTRYVSVMRVLKRYAMELLNVLVTKYRPDIELLMAGFCLKRVLDRKENRIIGDNRAIETLVNRVVSNGGMMDYHGIRRYENDTWNGNVNNEKETWYWPLGLVYKGFISYDEDFGNLSDELQGLKKVYSKFGCIPEMVRMTGDGLISNGNMPLYWAEAMASALDKGDYSILNLRDC